MRVHRKEIRSVIFFSLTWKLHFGFWFWFQRKQHFFSWRNNNKVFVSLLLRLLLVSFVLFALKRKFHISFGFLRGFSCERSQLILFFSSFCYCLVLKQCLWAFAWDFFGNNRSALRQPIENRFKFTLAANQTNLTAESNESETRKFQLEIVIANIKIILKSTLTIKILLQSRDSVLYPNVLGAHTKSERISSKILSFEWPNSKVG